MTMHGAPLEVEAGPRRWTNNMPKIPPKHNYDEKLGMDLSASDEKRIKALESGMDNLNQKFDGVSDQLNSLISMLTPQMAGPAKVQESKKAKK